MVIIEIITDTGGFTEWSEWSTCTKTCGLNATKTRNRECQDENRGCIGETTETQTCSPFTPCPGN